MTVATHYVQGDQKRTLLDKHRIAGWRGRWSNGHFGAARRQNARGGAVLYHVGSYHCSDGKWKDEGTSREHTPTVKVRPFAGHIATMGFAGTYTDEGAEFEATALVGKRSLRLRTVFRLLVAD
jgi:hypothetical protein